MYTQIDVDAADDDGGNGDHLDHDDDHDVVDKCGSDGYEFGGYSDDDDHSGSVYGAITVRAMPG